MQGLSNRPKSGDDHTLEHISSEPTPRSPQNPLPTGPASRQAHPRTWPNIRLDHGRHPRSERRHGLGGASGERPEGDPNCRSGQIVTVHEGDPQARIVPPFSSGHAATLLHTIGARGKWSVGCCFVLQTLLLKSDGPYLLEERNERRTQPVERRSHRVHDGEVIRCSRSSASGHHSALPHECSQPQQELFLRI